VHNLGSSPQEIRCFLWTSSETHLSPGIGDIGDFKILDISEQSVFPPSSSELPISG